MFLVMSLGRYYANISHRNTSARKNTNIEVSILQSQAGGLVVWSGRGEWKVLVMQHCVMEVHPVRPAGMRRCKCYSRDAIQRCIMAVYILLQHQVSPSIQGV